MFNVLKRIAVLAAFAFLLAACGGDSDDGSADSGSSGSNSGSSGGSETTSSTNGASEGGDVLNRQEPGRAVASVDGREFAFDTVGPVGCTINDSEVTVGFIFGDNEVSFVAGATPSGSEWRGRIDVNVQGSDGITTYSADFSGGDSGAVAVDGSSMSYSGAWEVLRPGSDAEPVGQGTLSATCG
jgi:hypothetical protein